MSLLRPNAIITVAVIICMTKATSALHVTYLICSFETSDDLCGWEDVISDHEGETGIMATAGSAEPPFPQTDTNPGDKNGSYFYYKRPRDLISKVYILQYPRQQYITSISFSYFISGLMLLRVVQTGVHSTDIVSGSNWSGNQTAMWDLALIQLNETNLKYGIAIVSPSLEAELGEAELEVDPILAIDNLTIEFTLPCNFDQLSFAGNIILSVPDALDIPLGEKTVVQFTASSTVCPDGPFVYMIESNDHPELNDIFTMEESTGTLTIDATTGTHLATEGVKSGQIKISVQVQGSDYLGTGNIVKRYSVLVYQQDPTITIESPTTLSVKAFTPFTYLIEATSHVGSNLMYNNLQTTPSSLHSNMSVESATVSGVITQFGLVEIIKLGKIPSFTIDVSDEYGGTIPLTVQLLLPSIPPTFNKGHYVFHIKENLNAEVIGNLTVGDVNEDNCADLTVTLSSNDSEAIHYFNLISYGEVSGTQSVCEFLLFTSYSLDYETKTQYHLTVTANDTDGQSVVTMVTVKVTSVNEYTPQFSTGTVKITTDYMSYVGELIYELEATDTDTGPAGDLHYSIASGNTAGNFKLNQTSNNRVDLLSKSDGLLPGNYPVQVSVIDGQDPFRSDTVLVIVVVTEGTIDCSNDLFGPPKLAEVSTTLFDEPVNSDAIIFCNQTSFPPAYPTQWTVTKLDLATTPISESEHYSIDKNKLTIHGLTPEDSQLYRCNVTSPCGSVVSTPVFIQVVEPPESIIDLRVADGPYKDYAVLSWTPPTSSSTYPIDGYIVMLKEGENGDYFKYQDLSYHEPDAELPLSEAGLTGLKPGTNYSVIVFTYNIADKRVSNEILFKTDVSAPKLSYFEAISLSNHSIRIEWVLEYSGGSDNIHMTVEVRSREVKRQKRSATSISLMFEVGVNDKILVTPSLPFGRSYQIISNIENEYGSTSHVVTAFIGVQDTVHCSFSSSSSCQWQLVGGKLQTGSSHTKEEPEADARGLPSGAYVIIPVESPDSSTEVLSYPSASYLCGYTFYYQMNDEVRLLLGSSSSSLVNESLYWASSVADILQWTREEVPAGDIPISLAKEELVFVMEAFEEPSVVSFAAIDEISLYFCLPCNYSLLTNDSILISSLKNLTLYLRSQQKLTIETEIKNCTNPLLNYVVTEVIPSYLRAKISIPDPKEGTIIISDITPDMASIGMEGNIQVTVEVANADYKHNGLVLSKSVVVPFVLLEKFENCSDTRNCHFDNGPCDWTLSDQSDSRIITETSGNLFLITQPPSTNSQLILKVAETTINDSFCGFSFLFKTRKSDVQVSVEGLGVIWSTIIVEELDPRLNTSSVWQEVSLYIDVLGVERREGRKLFIELLLSDLGDNSEAMASFDNVTLHPCVDCQAKECSCISCIQQCGTDPCQTGYYLSLEVNQCRPCPAGYYCSDWRSLPTPCPLGTFNNRTGAWSKDNCQICPNNTYSLKTAATSCDKCPSGHTCLEGGKLPVPNTSAAQQSNHLAVVIGAAAGVALVFFIAIVFGICCYCRAKYKKSVKRKHQKTIYKDNFLRGLNDDSRYCSRGPKSGTMRTVSTVMSSKDNDRDNDTAIGTIDKEPFYGSLDSSDDEGAEKQNNLLPLGRFSRDGTVSSLKSMESTKDWRDINPFCTSESSSDMSVLIELNDEKEHVWSALKKKKRNKKKMDDETNSLF